MPLTNQCFYFDHVILKMVEYSFHHKHVDILYVLYDIYIYIFFLYIRISIIQQLFVRALKFWYTLHYYYTNE